MGHQGPFDEPGILFSIFIQADDAPVLKLEDGILRIAGDQISGQFLHKRQVSHEHQAVLRSQFGGQLHDIIERLQPAAFHRLVFQVEGGGKNSGRLQGSFLATVSDSRYLYGLVRGNRGDALDFRPACIRESLLWVDILGQTLAVLHEIKCHKTFPPP